MKRKRSLRLSTVGLNCFILITFLSSPLLHAEVRGPAFLDPADPVAMGVPWEKQDIEHEEWAVGADLAVTLDQHLYPALTPFIMAYAKQENLKIMIQEGTCGISAGLLSKKHVDIGGVCCPPGRADRLPDLQHHTLGISALGILVNSENPVNEIKTKTAQDIFQGRIINWAELTTQNGVAGYSLPIRPIGRLHCKKRPGHWRLILNDEDLFAPRLYEVGTIKDMINTIAENRGAIGYEVLWNIKRFQQTEKVKPLNIDNSSPSSPADLISGKYPFYRVYNITTWKTDSKPGKKHAMKLVRYLLSHTSEIEKSFEIIPAKRLRDAGWKFNENELIDEP